MKTRATPEAVLMDALTLLQQRNSHAKLTEPGPDAHALEQMLRAAARAPEHGRLQPWRFIAVEGAGRQRLGALFVEALRRRKPDASKDEIQKNENAPQRAPLVIVVIARLRDHHKVPRVEQLLSAGCAAYGIVLAAQALGYGAIWRTGDNSYDATVKAGLGLGADEEIVGYLYIGTPAASPKPLSEPPLAELLSRWN
jgi:nitroreductase